MFSRKSVSLRRKRYYVVYPEYFDKNRSRKQGRRVPLTIADEAPSLKKVAKVCEILKYEPIMQPEKSYSSIKNGRILLPINKQNKIVKGLILNRISRILIQLVKKQKAKKSQFSKLRAQKTVVNKTRKTQSAKRFKTNLSTKNAQKNKRIYSQNNAK